MEQATLPRLGPFEGAALAVARLTNERPGPKRLQDLFVRNVSRSWVRRTVERRAYVDGVEWLVDLQPDRGVVLCANHRSFFDQYIAMLALWDSGVTWDKRSYFPVRANFFYENPAGMLLNLLVGGGAMYPPIFRERAKAGWNKDAIERLVGFLREPGTLVGMHPEGTRGKGPDPYELLPAQPGVGEVILRARPLVVPLFIGGLRNEFVAQARLNYHPDVRRRDPLILCFGRPVEYVDLTVEAPRLALYKRTADRVRAAIAALGERERELRAACLDGRVGDDDPGWLRNRVRRRRAPRRLPRSPAPVAGDL
jgi:1-acyl-sn-glycerol-3-phosphate acyltransferase